MILKTKLYGDKQGRQYQVPIPKTVIKLMGLKHKDEFRVEIEGNKIILTKCEG